MKLEDFNKFVASIDCQNVVKDAGKEAAKRLQKSSPVGRRKKDKYRDTWETKFSKKNMQSKVINKKNYRLTHLLENGHLIVNKIGSLGWAKPQPHIKIVYKEMEDWYLDKMKKAQVKFEIK